MSNLVKSNKQLLQISKKYDDLSVQDIPVTNVIDINPVASGADIPVVSSKLGSKRSYTDKFHTTANFNIETIMTGKLITHETNVYSNLDSLFLMSGLKRTLDTTNIIYSPDSDAYNELELKLYKQDITRTVVGGISNMIITGTVGEPLKVSFSVSGYTDMLPENEAIPASNETIEDIFIINKITGANIDGQPINMTNFTFNLNVSVQDTYSTGVSQYDMVDFDPSLEITALKILNNNEHWSKLFNGNLESVIISATSLNTNAKFLLTIQNCKLNNLTEGEDAGRQIVTRTYRAESNVGDDNFTLYIGK